VLDLGSGPGTALWAVADCVPSAERFTAVERNQDLIAIARRFAGHSSHPALVQTSWVQADLRNRPELDAHDLVILSYALGELSNVDAIVEWAWNLARVAVVIVEPGRPKAFQQVLAARNQLIGAGALIAAPCPHHDECPLAAHNDWCHFRARLERSAEHRRLKGGELGYEDEKFSYVIAARSVADRAQARIVRHPLKNSGHVRITLCTPDGLQTPTIGKSKKELYRMARNAEWGDPWPTGA
jgi:ribosomal protein RSM22 (predicted rRNA methylase)